MAKSRKTKKQRDEDDDDDDEIIEAEPFEDEEEEYDEREKVEKPETAQTPKSKGFFQQVGDSLKSAGQTAEKYTRIGITMAELEKLRMDLKSSYQKLGETITRCWDAAPDIGVSAHDSDVKDHVKKVNALRRQIREVEAKIRTLKTGDKEEAKK